MTKKTANTLAIGDRAHPQRAQQCLQPAIFANGKLWLALLCMVGLQILVVHWGPAQGVFDTVALSLKDWGLAVVVAASVLFLEEGRKFLLTWFGGKR